MRVLNQGGEKALPSFVSVQHPSRADGAQKQAVRRGLPLACYAEKTATACTPTETAASLRSQNHRITEWSGLEGTSVGHPVQPSCRSRVTYSRLHRTTSRRVLNISREGDSTTSLGRERRRAGGAQRGKSRAFKGLLAERIDLTLSRRAHCAGSFTAARCVTLLLHNGL